MRETYTTSKEAVNRTEHNGFLVSIESNGEIRYIVLTAREYSLTQLRAEKVIYIETIVRHNLQTMFTDIE